MAERFVWLLVVAIGLVSCLLYAGKLMGEPLKINLRDCPVYARDGYVAAQKRVDGWTKQQVLDYWNERKGNYTMEQWPHVLALLDQAFITKLDPKAFGRSLLDDCVANDGWLGRES